jgi:subtilisin family serine protease
MEFLAFRWINGIAKQNNQRDSIIVAVIDTQIDLNHEDLQGQIWTN